MKFFNQTVMLHLEVCPGVLISLLYVQLVREAAMDVVVLAAVAAAMVVAVAVAVAMAVAVAVAGHPIGSISFF